MRLYFQKITFLDNQDMSRIEALNRQLHICYFSELHFKGRGYLSLGAETMKIISKYIFKNMRYTMETKRICKEDPSKSQLSL